MPTIKQDHVNELYGDITGIIKNKNSHLYSINIIKGYHNCEELHQKPEAFISIMLNFLCRKFSSENSQIPDYKLFKA
jgi:hypothetical protein